MQDGVTSTSDHASCECTEGSPNATPSRQPANALPTELTELFAELDQCTESIPLDFLRERLDRLTFRLEDVESFARFDTRRYRRNLLHNGPTYHALLLCWSAGQRSPIHDHRGSACGVRIVCGSAMETLFEQTPEGHIYPTLTHELGEGFVCANMDMDIHQISNLQENDVPLVTLHIYSPPLNIMGTYSLTDEQSDDYEDPVYEFCFDGGAGI